MKLELRGLSSGDVDEDGNVADPENCIVSVAASIGPLVEGVDIDYQPRQLFYFQVATVRFIDESVKEDGYYAVPGTIVLRKFSFEAVRSAIEKIIADIEGEECFRNCEHWPDFGEELNKYGLWEYFRVDGKRS